MYKVPLREVSTTAAVQADDGVPKEDITTHPAPHEDTCPVRVTFRRQANTEQQIHSRFVSAEA